MKKIMAKYNNAFGYVKGYFTLCGLVGAVAVIAGIVLIIMGDKSSIGMSAGEMATGIIVPGIILLIIAVMIVLTTRKKCPEDKQGLVDLTLNMMIVGLGAAFVFGWWCFKKIMQLTLGLIGIQTSSSTAKESLSAFYYKNSDESDEWSCSECGDSIILTGTGAGSSRGETVYVWRSGDSNILCDEADNLYYPK